MKVDSKTLGLRLLLLGVCAGVAITCMIKINETYDPLARYPYVTEQNRPVILAHLDAKEIDYMITQQLKPDQYLEFINEPDFSIYNTLFYARAKKAQDAPAAYIVNFINKYRSNFSLDTLTRYLSHYSYADLTSFYENEQILHEDVQLAPDPAYPYLVLNENLSVYRYVPDGLSDLEGTSLKSEAAQRLKAMLDDYKKIVGENESLGLESGYLNYEQVLDRYLRATLVYGEYVDRFALSCGENEQQLGYTVALTGAQRWDTLVAENKAFVDYDYTKVEEELGEAELETQAWLRANAWRYGFVVRYPQGKEEVTGHYYQPYLLRYVGQKTAKAMVDENKTMEEMDFEEELQ